MSHRSHHRARVARSSHHHGAITFRSSNNHTDRELPIFNLVSALAVPQSTTNQRQQQQSNAPKLYPRQRDFNPSADIAIACATNTFTMDITPSQTLLKNTHTKYLQSTPSTPSQGLRIAKMQEGCALYIRYGTNEQAHMLAKYRHDFIRLPASVVGYRIAAASSSLVPATLRACPFCHATIDNRIHMLLHCPSHNTLRRQTQLKIFRLIDHTADARLLMGDIDDDNVSSSFIESPECIQSLLTTIHKYLKTIHTARFPIVVELPEPP